ncbi:hypothetical protein brsh051_07570 [Brooklawnia propionicigenes]|uniref:Uncharacterized protein n=1 Tax=Brooklawnia propionicigenes TaxID=3041175 RepID=A0AAN0K7G3_9ACTN|nr:hypothetical protein brsh051_07570 [Brooklawnia sp. SH051]
MRCSNRTLGAREVDDMVAAEVSAAMGVTLAVAGKPLEGLIRQTDD